MQGPQPSTSRDLRLPDVIAEVGLSKTEIYRRIRDGRFPKPKKRGPRTSVWPYASLIDWRNAEDSELMDLLG